jgi:predicted transcriptional regulator
VLRGELAVAKAQPTVSETELAILDVLWDHGPVTVADITVRLYPEGTQSQYATVKSLLGRLETKGYVTRDASGFAHVYQALVQRDSFIGQQLKQMADRVCGGSVKLLLFNLVEGSKLSKRDRDALRKMIDEAE